mgnify:CR=1 FL=1
MIRDDADRRAEGADLSLIYERGHVDEYHTMNYFGNPEHAQSTIACMILTEYFWKFQWKIALWECCYHALLVNKIIETTAAVINSFMKLH